jgi:hypothetical protein
MKLSPNLQGEGTSCGASHRGEVHPKSESTSTAGLIAMHFFSFGLLWWLIALIPSGALGKYSNALAT